MTSRIQALPTEVVHLIAAGEVIDSLAAVVRELVENALDAGATRLTITVWPQQWRVQIADNGSGMNWDELQQAATPHSTSKIQGSQDLWRIRSLGFRGEALHSLAQLANLEISSREAGAPEGWRIGYSNQGDPVQVEPIAIAPGTIVTASNLFAILPARRQGLPSLSQQLRLIQTVIQQMALCHPTVTWQVKQGDRPWFAIWPGDSAKSILPQLVRDLQVSDLHELTVAGAEAQESSALTDSSTPSQPSPSLYLLIGLPDRCHRHRPDWIRVAINGRVVKVPELEQSIFGAFRRTMPRDRYPVCFLHLQVEPNQVDWNRHPAKAEIYLHRMSLWQEQVTAAIAQALRLSPAQLPDSAYSAQVGQLLKAAEAEGVYANSRTIQSLDFKLLDIKEADSKNLQDLEDLEAELDGAKAAAETHLKPQNSEALQPLRAIAQLHNMYILVEQAEGLWLIEQHIAHERVLYEQLCDRWQLIPLEPPMILRQLTPAQVEQLGRIGLEVDLFGDQLWAVRTAPAALAHREDCAEALLELSLGGDLESALVATACRTAIRNGMPLTLPELQTLLDQWQQTRNPHTCPHGRPICLALKESSLSRFFRRHWVIGKSHGI